MLGKQFNKIIRSMDQRPRSNVKNISSDISRSYNSGRRDKSEEKYNHSKGIQCHECEGYGHIKAECPTYLKKQKRGLSVSWSDEDSESDFEEESAKHVTALTGIYNSDEDSSEDELSFEELATSYRKLCIRSAEVCQQGEKQKKYIAQLEADNKELNETISELNDEIILLQSKLDQMSKSVKMLNNGTDMLEEILQVGKSSRDMTGIGFVSTKKYVQDSSRTKPEAEMSKPMSKHVTQHHEKGEMKRKFQRWRCHYCGRFGHIKPFCFRLYGYPDQAPSYKPKQIMPIQKQQWKPKSMALIAHTSLSVSAKEDWYFDSGCSRHMTGLKDLFVDIKSHSTSYVTFGDGAKGEINGVGKLDCSGVPNLEDVLLVKDLNVNLISISQLCDQGYQVNFTKDECVVTNEEKEVVMRGVRSKNNCFLWVSQESSYSTICSKEEEAKLWHQKLGHLYLRDWAGSADNRKRISGGCSFVRCSCSQLVWMKQMLTEYNVTQDVMTLYCDNLGAINTSKNSIQHSRPKHSNIIHRYIRDLVKDKIIDLEHVASDLQLADSFTKVLDANKFENQRNKLDICLSERLWQLIESGASTISLSKSWISLHIKVYFPPLLQVTQTVFIPPKPLLHTHSISLCFYIHHALPSSSSYLTMSQSPSSKKPTPISETASGSRAPNAVSDQDVVLDVVPLNSVPPSDSARSHPRKMHARKSTGGSVPETFSVQGREGSSYVHNAIANIVTRILNEGHKVEEISVPLAQMPASDDDQGEHDEVSKDQENVETSASDDRTFADNDETHVVKDVETSAGNDKTPAAKDVETPEAVNAEPEKDEEVPAVPAVPAEKDENPKVHDVVDLDDLDDPIDIADDDLISSISNRVKARKGKQVCDQQPLKPHVTPLKTVTKERVKRVSTGPAKSGSKVTVKKRKERSVSVTEDDVLSDVPDIPSKKKIAVTKSSTKVRDVPLDNIYLHYASNAIQWKFVYQRRLALERELANDALECQEIMKLIKDAGLIKTVSHFSKCYEILVKEFIVNLSQDCGNGTTDDFHKVYVRRKCIDFSPAVINLYLGRDAEAQPELEVTDNEVCKVITGGTVKKWPIKSKLSASSLNVRYALLHKIGAANWVPTNHTSTIAVGLGRFIYDVGSKTKFDYGTYIFDQTMRHVGTSATKLPIAFPSLTCGIILKQHPGILKAKDSVCKRESALSFHYKLLQRSDDMTSAGTSQPSKSVNKTFLIVELKETCKELDNRKMKLEKLIQSLEQSAEDDHAGERDGDNMDEDKGAEEEAEDAEAEDAESGSSDAAEGTSSSSDDNPGDSSDEDSDGSDD